jgi:hypothetical protein
MKWIIAGVGVLASAAITYAAAAHADTLFVEGPTGIATPNAAEMAVAEWYAEASGMPSGATLEAITTPEQDSNASYLTGEQDTWNAIEAAYQSGQISSADPAYVYGYSQSATIESVLMTNFADGEAPGTTTPIAGDAIPLQDLHFVFTGDPAADPDGVGGVAGVDGYMNVYGAWAALAGYTSIDGAKTPDNLYSVDAFDMNGDNWGIATNPLDVSPIEHEDYWGLPYQMSATQLIADATATHIGDATYYVIPYDDINQSLALIDALAVSLNLITAGM